MWNRATVRFCCVSMLAAANLLHSQDLTVVSAAGAQSVVAPGSLATVYGRFSTEAMIGQLNALGLFPTELGGFALDFNGVRAQLLYVGPEQINFVVPAEASFGYTAMNVSAPSGPRKTGATVQPVAPAIFTMIQGGREMGAILNAVTFKLGPFRPETPEIPGCDARTRLAVFATGLGLTTRRAKPRDVRVELQDASGSTLPADVEAAVAAPGFMGLDQINFVLPSGLRPGTVLMRLVVNGVASNRVQFDVDPGSAAASNSSCLAGVTVSRAPAQSGGPFQGTVSLAYPADAAGVAVNLIADPGIAVPASVTVPAGRTSAAFPMTVANTVGQIRVTATLNGSTRTGAFDQGPACVDGVALSSDGIVSGNGLKGSVILSDPAPGSGMAVDLIADNPLVTVTPSVSVTPGQMSAEFSVTTAAAVNPSKATITAAGACGGTSTVLNVVITPCIGGISLSAATASGGGKLTGTVKLTAPALAGGLVVNFTSSDPGVQVDTQVRVPEGESAATFNVNTSAVMAKTTVSVIASVGTCGSVVTTLTLMP